MQVRLVTVPWNCPCNPPSASRMKRNPRIFLHFQPVPEPRRCKAGRGVLLQPWSWDFMEWSCTSLLKYFSCTHGAIGHMHCMCMMPCGLVAGRGMHGCRIFLGNTFNPGSPPVCVACMKFKKWVHRYRVTRQGTGLCIQTRV